MSMASKMKTDSKDNQINSFFYEHNKPQVYDSTEKHIGSLAFYFFLLVQADTS